MDKIEISAWEILFHGLVIGLAFGFLIGRHI